MPARVETRPYFVAGDILATCVAGGASAVAASYLVAPGWALPAGIIVGMLAGMLLSLVLAFLFVPLFGAFEVMLPAMLAGMVAGMITGMTSAAGALDHSLSALVGVGVGLASVLYTYALNARARSAGRRGNRP